MFVVRCRLYILWVVGAHTTSNICCLLGCKAT